MNGTRLWVHLTALAMAAMVLGGTLPLTGGDDGHLLTDFETDADAVFAAPPGQVIVAEHAKSGDHSLRVTQTDRMYPGLRFDRPAQLQPFRKYPIFAVEVFNPAPHMIRLGVRADDADSADRGARFNDDRLVAPSGWSTLRINLTSLTVSNTGNMAAQRPLNTATLKLFHLFPSRQNQPGPIVVYFDHARLEDAPLPAVDGLAAFDFGPAQAAIFPGFTGVNEKSVYSEKTGFGWTTAGIARRPENPDDLGGDYGTGDTFTVDLKSGPGEYVVQLCIDTLGEGALSPFFKKRSVTLNGRQVLTENLDGKRYLQEKYYKFSNEDDLPGIDLWTDRVKPLTPVRTFSAQVGDDGKLTVQVDTKGGWPGMICFLVVYPQSRQAAGDAYMQALENYRKLLYANRVIVAVPPADHPAPQPIAAETARGFLWFSRSAADELATSAQPTAAEHSAPLELSGCRQERLGAQLGIVPLQAAAALEVQVSDLSGPDGTQIPGSAVQVRKVRIFAHRQDRSNGVLLAPLVLQPFTSLPLIKNLTRALWVTLVVPADATPGRYTGTVTLTVDGRPTAVPLNLTVHPFKLANLDDLSISAFDTSAGPWRQVYPELDRPWWDNADQVLANQAAHGCNAVTGGPGMKLVKLEDGVATIDFSETDRWLALARKHGLTQPGDSYHGLDVNLGFEVDPKTARIDKLDAAAQARYAVSFSDLIRMVYQAVETHAKTQNWPLRSYYLMDEPRAELGNVEAMGEVLAVYAKAAPTTRFSGFTAVTGEGREQYLSNLSVVISHPTAEELQRVVAAGKECWAYDSSIPGHAFGRWLYAARRKGLKGFTTGFLFPNPTPYFDMSGVMGNWGIVFPGPDGVIDTTTWERFACEVNTCRYLKTLEMAAAAAPQSGVDPVVIAAAQRFLDQIVETVDVGQPASAFLDGPAFNEFQAELVRQLTLLQPPAVPPTPAIPPVDR